MPSEGFGKTFIEKIIPAFFNEDKDGILSRSKMTENGQLTPAFSYLQDYVDGKKNKSQKKPFQLERFCKKIMFLLNIR